VGRRAAARSEAKRRDRRGHYFSVVTVESVGTAESALRPLPEDRPTATACLPQEPARNLLRAHDHRRAEGGGEPDRGSPRHLPHAPRREAERTPDRHLPPWTGPLRRGTDGLPLPPAHYVRPGGRRSLPERLLRKPVHRRARVRELRRPLQAGT